MRILMKVGLGVAGGVAAASVATAIGATRWKGETARAVARFEELVMSSPGGARGAYSESMLEGLPAPVARYFRYALVPGQRLIRTAVLEQSGTFATKPGAWVPFTATERMATSPMAFQWDASMELLPIVPTYVRDYYMRGEGGVRGSVAGLITVVRSEGTPRLAEGALMRWLAEGVWAPTALLPGGGVSWGAIDDSTARATAVDGAVSVSLDFHFAPDGRITGTSGLRWRDDGETSQCLPWIGRHEGYERVAGMMIPRQGEVGWELPTGYAGYWRGRQERLSFTFE